MTLASYYIILNYLMSHFFFFYYTLRLSVTFVNYFTFVNILPTFKLQTKYEDNWII